MDAISTQAYMLTVHIFYWLCLNGADGRVNISLYTYLTEIQKFRVCLYVCVCVSEVYVLRASHISYAIDRRSVELLQIIYLHAIDNYHKSTKRTLMRSRQNACIYCSNVKPSIIIHRHRISWWSEDCIELFFNLIVAHL